MKRKESILTAERNSAVVERIRQIKAEHPFWGYRRTWAHLKYVDNLDINKKRVLRLMQRHDLQVKPDKKLRATRTPTRSKPRPDRPNQWWGIDMTKVMVDGFGWMYIVVVLDWYTKKIAGYYTGMECRSKHWLEALDMAVNRQFPDGVRGNQLHLMSDNGSQPTSMGFMKTCRELDISQAFTSYNNPKGNADTERFMRTFKEEVVWPNEFDSFEEAIRAVEVFIGFYNCDYPHSKHNGMSPIDFEKSLSQIAEAA